jgi:hypothetical protein
VRLKQSLPFADHTLGIQIGGICCALKCEDNEVYHGMRELYRDFLAEEAADITVELELTDQPGPDSAGEASTGTEDAHEHNHSGHSGHEVSCKYDAARHVMSLACDKSLVDPNSEYNSLNNLFSLVYYQACRIKYDDYLPAMLVHSCGILRNGQVFMFAGPSGAGKTTIARLCGERDGEVINDEMLLISRQTPAGKGIGVQSAPIINRLAPWRKKSGLLRCILLLKQSDRTLVRSLPRTDAYLRFLRQIITPIYIGEAEMRNVLPLMAEFSDVVTAAVPVYELEFTLDGELLWQVVGELEKELIGRDS